MFFWPKGLPDLLEKPETAYDDKINAQEYEAEKGLLELYRNFVVEMLRISLAGVAVLGFLSKLAQGEPNGLDGLGKCLGASSMLFFAISSVLALAFLYTSANGYRCYIAGLRAKFTQVRIAYDAEHYLKTREEMLNSCRWTKFLAAVFLGLGALTATAAIWATLFKL